ncbi:hypothetical protein FB567DRAFT_629745 [Paraphoma chrysanthemicola]|uniref:Heterokaryon incompatibility domain-containing protein n=1 Tax=Paraphoma chrysanthemicola TaxID=798071 RepID=A0A8K0R5B4_9PLEO|nr:hypothetical protein FB567DRAFT_629745 [Paraphoma chrysanthemicola]
METPKRVGQDLPVFKHKRLDASNPKAIRLLQVLPDLSSGGLIQCKIFHDNIDAKFACLSYVWGDVVSQKAISIIDEDGLESFLVIRRNLWDFLDVARSKFSDPSLSKVDAQLEADSEEESEAETIARLEAAYVAKFDPNRTRCSSYRVKNLDHRLWIDAICIDQTVVSEDKQTPEYREILSERNQQIQMMGDIYRGRTVLAWLGCDKEIASFMVAFGQSWELVYFRQEERLGLRKSYMEQASDSIDSLKSLGGQKFSRNEYWNRAWITQELTLAGTVILLSGLQELGVWRIREVYKKYDEDESGGGGFQWQSPENYCWEYLTTAYERQEESLIRSLHTHRNKRCSLVHDRIFSLLALCEDGKRVVVDYQKPRPKLLVDTLCSCVSSLCFCAVATVAGALQMENDSEGDTLTPQTWLHEYGIQIQLFSVWPGARDRRLTQGQASLSQFLGRTILKREMTIDPRTCPLCFSRIPERFSQYKGRILCLRGCCGELAHFYWEYAERVVEKPGVIRTGKFYLSTGFWGRNFITLDKSFNIRMTDQQQFPNREFILNFTFATIIQIRRDLPDDRKQDVCEHVDRGKSEKKSKTDARVFQECKRVPCELWSASPQQELFLQDT